MTNERTVQMIVTGVDTHKRAAEPVVAAVIGGAGLIATVPLTTGLVALLIARVPADLLPSHGHSHTS
ncbi:MAG: hypothetical protein QOJ85_4237 [Solirubrobacteraceae bacterium]|jgi:hypothetical protein|nr:hypothetical protein [Solirubrobacteraceae bacterium]MEA2243763.1 hypothetical protein [Solirubrobacteraceae bacterium]